MPRVVQDQSHKFETDELFRKLSEDTEVCSVYTKEEFSCQTSKDKRTINLTKTAIYQYRRLY